MSMRIYKLVYYNQTHGGASHESLHKSHHVAHRRGSVHILGGAMREVGLDLINVTAACLRLICSKTTFLVTNV